MTSLRIRQYGSSEHTQVNFVGELENEICAGLITQLEGNGDLHLLVWSDELGKWIDV